MAFNWGMSRKIVRRRRQLDKIVRNLKPSVAMTVTALVNAEKGGLGPNEYCNKAWQDNADNLSLLKCLRPLFMVGKLLQICPFSATRKYDVPAGVALSARRASRIFGIVVKVVITAYTALLALTEADKTQKLPLMDYLWRCNFAMFALYTVAVRWSMEFQWAEWVMLFRKSYDIHMSYHMLGIKMNLDRLTWLAKVGTAVLPIAAAAHVYFVRRAYRKGPEKYLLGGPFNFSAESTIMSMMPFVTILFDYFAWVAQYFGDWLRLYLGLYVWTLFSVLQKSLVQTEEDGRGWDVTEVITLHMKVVSLLGTVNKLVGLITFLGCLHTLLYCCFYVNYFLSGDAMTNRLFVFLFYLLRNGTIYLISADVNAKAHSVAEWLESTAIAGGLEVPGNELPKLVVFSGQIYNKGSIGFKGMQFFTITSPFLAAILSLITSYTVVTTQFVLEAGTTKKLTKLCSSRGYISENGTLRI